MDAATDSDEFQRRFEPRGSLASISSIPLSIKSDISIRSHASTAPITPPSSVRGHNDDDAASVISPMDTEFGEQRPFEQNTHENAALMDPGSSDYSAAGHQIYVHASEEQEQITEAQYDPDAPHPPLRYLADEPPHLVDKGQIILSDFEVLETLGSQIFASPPLSNNIH